MDFRCPGAEHIRGTPTLTVKTCPNCGGEIEIFSTDMQVACDTCGFIAYNDAQNCVQWCQFAKECVGEALYEKLRGNQERKKENTSASPDAKKTVY